MTLVRVNPESLRTYGLQAQAVFDAIAATLDQLSHDVMTVRYSGPNAVSFQTECGRLAVEFGARLHADLASMADAVRRSTSNIAASLGGQPISLSIAGRPITPPVPAIADHVDVDTDALDGLVPIVAGRFTSIRDGLARHFVLLQQTDWEGTAKLAAVDAVGGFTAGARHACDRAEQSLAGYIRNQIRSVLAADR